MSLVDPDNRRPVNYERRVKFLQDIKEKAQKDILMLIDELFSTKEDGRIKLFLTYRVLQARKENLEVFQKGNYLPLEVIGKYRNHIIAFARSYDERIAVTVAPRFLTSLIQPEELPLGEVWEDTCIRLPQGMPSVWKDGVTTQIIQGDGTMQVSDALKHFPVALPIGQSDG